VRAVLVSLALSLASVAQAQDPAPADTPAETPAETPAAETPTAETPAASSADEAAVGLRAPDDAPLPKVAIVLFGDPDAPALAAIDAVQAALGTSAALRLPADPALVQALSGRGEGDGLDDVRSERRGLGLSERRDLPVLVRLGRLATATALVLVRPQGEGLELVVLDVRREAFFDGALALPATDADVRRFVERRTRAAATATDAPAAAAPTTATPVDEPEPAEEASPADGEEASPADGDPVLHWFEENWAYLAAGALLAGGIVFVAVVATDPGAPPPMLRFTPGAP
jgi:hypothetical protein